MLRAALTSGGGRLTALLPHHHARMFSSSYSSSSTIASLFSDPTPPADPAAAMQSAGVDLSHPDTVPALLLDPGLSGNYPAASRFFSWAASDPATKAALNSRSFNSMLQLAAAHGDAERFWSLVASMRSRGYGISKPAFRAASESFRAKDMTRDADLLQEAFAAHGRNAAAAEGPAERQLNERSHAAIHFNPPAPRASRRLPHASAGGRRLLDRMCLRPPLSASLFNSLIASRARVSRSADALSLLVRMLAAGVAPTAFTFAPILSSPFATACCAAQLHPHILKSGLLHCEPYSGTSLVGFFGRSGRFDEALKVFGEMTVRSVVTWNCLISSFVQFGRSCDALLWFREFVRSSDGLSDGSLVAVLPAFGSPVEVHGLVKKTGMDSFSAVANALMNSYCTCGSIQVAEKMFSELVFRDVASWNTMIIGFARSNVPNRAFELFLSMQHQSDLPNETTFASVLYACASMNGHEHGKFIHAKLIKRNLNTSVFVNTSLVDFYANCIGWRDAHKVVEEVTENSTTCWNALISAHYDSDGPTSLVILRDMLRSGIKLNEVTFSASLKDPSLLDLQQIHSFVIRLGLGASDYISSGVISSYGSHGVVSDALTYGVALDPDSCRVSMNVLAGVYNKARRYQETKELLLHQQARDTVSWCILITACARNGECIDAFGFFKQMRIFGHHADNYVFVSLLSICSKNNSLDLGKSIHGLIIKANFGCSDTYVDNVLLDMYAKCGRIEDCLRVFEEMKDRNLISWTAVISGLGLNGFSHKALAWFKAMEKDGCKPDKVAILAVLSACRHGRLVREGMKIFKNMKADYSVEAEMEHYVCVVDMLCKCGHLKEAEVVIRGMPFQPFQPSSVIWRTFLQGCKTYCVTETQVFS